MTLSQAYRSMTFCTLEIFGIDINLVDVVYQIRVRFMFFSFHLTIYVFDSHPVVE